MNQTLRYRKWKKIIKESGLFDPRFYLFAYPDVRINDIDPIIHYIKFGAKEGRKPHKDFDTKYYIKSYQDVERSGLNPLVHYILYGMHERRAINESSVGECDFSYMETPSKAKQSFRPGKFKQHFKEGKKRFYSDRLTIMVVTHESSATGAPLLSLNIGNHLSKKYNVINLVMKNMNIHEVFFENSFLVIDDFVDYNPTLVGAILEDTIKDYNVECCICNSVVTFPILQAASSLEIATVSLIHEFAEYTKPKTKMLTTVLAANRVVLPAKIILDSIMEQFECVSSVRQLPSNVFIRPQGKLESLPDVYGISDSPNQILEKLKLHSKGDYKIIVASGYVQIRKGVDLFIYIARYVKKYYSKPCKFVWVGDGFMPETDANYSMWLEREIRHLGLADDFIFLEHQTSLNSIFQLADVFCLTSRMDPFPNVVVDAMEADLPIACFRDASGSVELLDNNDSECIIADYLDTHQLGKLIAEYLNNDNRRQLVNKKIVREELDYYEYVTYIEQMVREAISSQRESHEIVKEIKKRNVFDAEFNKINTVRSYVAACKRNLHQVVKNPLPGFSNHKWMVDHGSRCVPLYEAIKNDKHPRTHDCVIIPNQNAINTSITFKYAVHLHLFYTDLVDEFVSYFKNLPGQFDLYITIINPDDHEMVSSAFAGCGAQRVVVVMVDNIGRDVGPLLFNLKDKLLNNGYEVVGHFHSKKSVSVNGDLGDRWRKYLMKNLIGDSKDIATSVLSLFDDLKNGLVFAEDNHYADIGKNKEYINKLAGMMGIHPIEETPLFPLGNMYWARLDAIKELFELDKDVILQPEPLPYDGTFIHALERITPFLIEKNGYQYKTVYKSGTTW